MNLHGDLAESWNVFDPLTYVFHLRRGIHFHDGRPLTSADVRATFDFILDPANRSPKRGGFRMVTSVETPDDATVIFHLREPYASFTVNLLRSAVGIVPSNASSDFARQRQSRTLPQRAHRRVNQSDSRGNGSGKTQGSLQ